MLGSMLAIGLKRIGNLIKRKWRNEATKFRQTAIRKYWQQRADHLKSKPTDFYRTFRQFLSDKS